ncbi:MAG: RHS repeat-associated core domain-containing protein [Chthonomonadetes bacterium]|nr:RHS repeat-associated core domain-containing protein [Chthonomonadetes bacterium]
MAVDEGGRSGEPSCWCRASEFLRMSKQWGYYRDMETGLLLLTFRYLDPATGRFLTRDPIGVEGGVNLYAYVGNGVVVNADPAGLMLWIVPIPCNGKTPAPSPCRGVSCYRNPPLPRPPKDPPRYRRFPCPAGKWPFYGFCLGSPADCLRVFNPLIGGEPMRDLCLECCEAVGNGLGWSWRQRSDCDNACLLVGLPS